MSLRELIYLFTPRRVKFYPSHRSLLRHPTFGEIPYEYWVAPGAVELNADSVALEAEALREFLLPGDIAIDIGAHNGDSALPMCLAVGRNGRVIALEPNPVTFRLLAMNAFNWCHISRLLVFPFAAGDKDFENNTFDYGRPWLTNGGYHSTSSWAHGSAFEVPVRSMKLETVLSSCLDQEDLTKVRYLKIDVEGMDFQVLSTAVWLIRKASPVIKFEIMRKTSKANREGISSFFEDLGYSLFLITDEVRMERHQVPLDFPEKNYSSANYLAIPN